MAEDHIVISSGRSLTYEEVAARTFATSFRGFDQAEVRLFLKRVGDELLALAENERQLRQSLDEARERAAHPELDEKALTAALGESTALRERAASESAAELEAARMQGKEMVGEAQAVRERLLGDLARRRRLAHVQIEQLRAGRERLLEAYRVVRRTLDEATEELTVAEAEARVAA